MPGIAQNQVEAAFGFPGEERDAELEGPAVVRARDAVSMDEAAGDVKAADADRTPRARRGAISMRAGKLVGLHAYEDDQAGLPGGVAGNAIAGRTRVLVSSRA